MWSHPQETADLVTFTEEILYEKHHILCRVLLHTEGIDGTALNATLDK